MENAKTTTKKQGRRLRVLMSAYACEPGKGSEPEVGWKVAITMAKLHDVQVITRANNRPLIEKEVSKLESPLPEFLYYDLPKPFLLLKRRFKAVALYYFLWQIAVRWVFRKELRKVDLVHHVTFNGLQMPGFWIVTDTPVVLGPLGGGMTCPAGLLPLLGVNQKVEERRTQMIRRLSWLPWWRLVMSNARVVLAANQETAETIEGEIQTRVSVMLETAVDRDVLIGNEGGEERLPRFTFLWLGGLIPRKAANLGILGLKEAIRNGADVELWIAGNGSEEERLKKLVSDEDLNDRVQFLGRIDKAEVNALMDRADAFLFTSVRDTSGNVVLEAMSRGLPVLALCHQGVQVMCDAESAYLVQPGRVEETIREIGVGMQKFQEDPALATRLCESGRKKVARELTWDCYAVEMDTWYQKAANDI